MPSAPSIISTAGVPEILPFNSGSVRVPEHLAPVLSLWNLPSNAGTLTPGEWNSVIRVGRMARLLGSLHARIERSGQLQSVPQYAAFHLKSEWNLAAYRKQMIIRELRDIQLAVGTLKIPIIALKGAAYIVQQAHCAAGRAPSDVDIMVRKDSLGVVECALKSAGWEMSQVGSYDEHYYREWTHELPPFRMPGHPVELDLHHGILPPVGRLKPDMDSMIAHSVAGRDGFYRVLSEPDQVLHTCVHLFQDSDLSNRLRDLADIDSLLREYSDVPGFWERIVARANLHGFQRPLWYSIHYSKVFFKTPVPDSVIRGLDAWAPGKATAMLMNRLVPAALCPHNPDALPSTAVNACRSMLLARSHWLRMPLHLLARHAAVKFWRRFMPRKAQTN
ncbi:MAG: nucleotidyltransferase family protein [Burkholderiales bacterium]